jgi:hypothetical protein
VVNEQRGRRATFCFPVTRTTSGIRRRSKCWPGLSNSPRTAVPRSATHR